MNNIKEGSQVLYIWDGELNSIIEANVNEIKNIKNIQLKVENLQRIGLGECFSTLFVINHFIVKRFHFILASYSNSTFDVIATQHTVFNRDILALILKLLKPSGKFTINSSDGNLSQLKENIILSGFVNVQDNTNGKFDDCIFLYCELHALPA